MSSTQPAKRARERISSLIAPYRVERGRKFRLQHVMSGVSPQGCQVYSFKQPSSEELDHDFLWRTSKNAPERDRIGIFTRSYYEEVLVVRTHPELPARQHMPTSLVGRNLWAERFEDINAYEDMIRNTATRHAPWFVVPADNQLFSRLVVAAAVIDAMDEMDLHFPKIDAAKRRELQDVRRLLEKSSRPAKRTR